MGIITGLWTQDVDEIANKIESMTSCQKHRDNTVPVVYIQERIALAMANHHNALYFSLGSKAQPQTISSQTSSSDIIALIDGILLDVPQHSKSLLSENIQCQPTCSHIIELAYRKWGLDFAERLEGEFSCAVWDAKQQRLVLVRDPYGHKPLHYYSKDGLVAFSSEIKGILAAGVQRSIDMTALSDLLSLNCIPYPATIFKDIYQVPPGCMVIIENDTVRTKQYWSPKMNVTNIDMPLDEAVSQFSHVLSSAVKKRIVAEDTYCFLSGGIDSSALVSFAAELSSKPIHCISVGFKDEERNELEFAAAMSKHVGAVHHQVIATPDSFLEMLETLVVHHDSPFTDTSAFPTYFAGELARGITDVIMTGDGPDQMLGGSGHHVFALKNNLFNSKNKLNKYLYKAGVNFLSLVTDQPVGSIAAKVRRKLYRDSVSPVHTMYDLRSCFPDIAKQYICTDALWETHRQNNPYRHPESWFKEAGNVDDINKYLYADMKFYVTDDLMIKVDRMCMAHGLETLSPFQDKAVGQFANSLPGKYKMHISETGEIITKYLLKQVCKDRFPPIIMNKPKQGFGIPLANWLRHNGCQFLKETLLDSKFISRGYFKKEAVERLVHLFATNNNDYYFPSPMGIVALLTLELWHRKYLDSVTFKAAEGWK